MTEHISHSTLRVDGDRLWQSLMRLAEIGATPKGGVKRLTLTEEDRGARDLFARWAREAGLAVCGDNCMGFANFVDRLRVSGYPVLSDEPPGGVVLLLFEAVFTVTDPPLRALRRFIPPVRIGAVAFDLAILVLFIGTQVLIAVVSGLARA